MSLGKSSKKTSIKTITENIVKQELGHKYYLLKDKEAYIVATTEIEEAHGLPRDTNTIYDELQQVLHGVVRQVANNTITSPSALRYSRRGIACLNKEEENKEGQKRKITTGIIKVSGLIHKREKQCDPRLTWEMFHKIYHM